MTQGSRHVFDRLELAPLWQELHARLSSGRTVARITVEPLSPASREALADLLGLDRLPGTRATVSLTRLDEVVREAVGGNARAVAEAIVGPLANRAAERDSDRAARESLWDWLEGHPVVTTQPALLPWARSMRRAGLIRGSVEGTRRHLSHALTVLAALPAQGDPLPVFAAEHLGDAHALDDGTRLSGAVLRAVAALHDTEPPTTAARRRAAWGLVGIADDALSTTALTAGLRPAGAGAVARSLTAYADAGHAAHLTLAQLRDPGELRLPSGDVHVTENPSVLALALREFGAACPALVCTSGWPGGAVVLLLRQLAAAGASLHYHGDFDGEGLRIAAHVMAATGARPWRMSARDYESAHARTPTGPPPGRVTDAPWDARLAAALVEQGAAVLEEHVADALMGDLARHRCMQP
ncbi:TIGR02679 family protein [Streptomyces sp. NBC_01361]|uniref:TIGR02679 family protein n=1 Tax=Streptomyces sp. NBC_01361 TaxID=2903838 RepID=UPI002E335D45|nr:TIGR02679 family protein [Streptomyces sp. NBC_01361]